MMLATLNVTQTLSDLIPSIDPILRLSQPFLEYLAKSITVNRLALRTFEEDLPGLLRYVPLVCRLIALILAAPLVVCIVLDVIAYGIARTLHLSMSSHRVPRSPPPANMPLGIHSQSFQSEDRNGSTSLPPSLYQASMPTDSDTTTHRTRSRKRRKAFDDAEPTSMLVDRGEHVTEGLALTFPLESHRSQGSQDRVNSKSSSLVSLNSLASASSTQTSNGSSISLDDGPVVKFETRFPPSTQALRQPGIS